MTARRDLEAPTTTKGTTTMSTDTEPLAPGHDDPGHYGCHPAAYLAPDMPEGWRLVAMHSPPEPSGWWGACRVILARRPGGDYCTAVARPSGGLFFGRYDQDRDEAAADYSRRCQEEDTRAARYDQDREALA